MSMQMTIYEKSPIPLQNLLLSGIGFQKNRTRFGKAYDEHRDFLKSFDQWSREEQLEYQRKELVRFVQYAYKHSPFYRELYREVDMDSFQSLSDLKRLPMVDKEILRDHLEKVTTIPRSEAVINQTSGSTGKPFQVYFTKEDMMKRSAQLDHYKARIGFENLKMKKASFSGRAVVPYGQKKKEFWRYNFASKQMFYSTLHVTEENLPYYVESLNQFKPQALDGYFSAMVLIANYIERHNPTLEFTPIGIFPTAENIDPSGKKLLERVFQCKVYDQYASSEGAPFITECSHQRLHIELSSGVFEHMDDSSNEILVTSFTTHGTPLIRYRIGDMLSFEEPEVTCTCGLESPLIKRLEGRNMDFLYTADGRKIRLSNMTGVFDRIPIGIVQAQFIQNRMDELTLLIQKDPKTFKPYILDILKEDITYRFGEATKLTMEFVDHIPKEKNGKFRLIKNNVVNR